MRKLVILFVLVTALVVPVQAGVYFKAQNGYTIDDSHSIYNGDFIYAMTLTNSWAPGAALTTTLVDAAISTPSDTLGLFNGIAPLGSYDNPNLINCCQTPFTGYMPPASIPTKGIRNVIYIVSTDPMLVLSSNNGASKFPGGRPGFEATTGFIAPGVPVPEEPTTVTLAGWGFVGLLFFGATRMVRKKMA